MSVSMHVCKYVCVYTRSHSETKAHESSQLKKKREREQARAYTAREREREELKAREKERESKVRAFLSLPVLYLLSQGVRGVCNGPPANVTSGRAAPKVYEALSHYCMRP